MDFKENRKILALLSFLIVLLMSLVIYLSYFTVFKAQNIIDNPANRREMLQVANIKRGTIYDRDMNVLSHSEGEKGNYTRVYTYPVIYSHLLGYSSKVRGNSVLEASYNKYLLGEDRRNTLYSLYSFFDKTYNKDEGDDLVLTTKTSIQQKARDSLYELGEKGAIVVMNPKTGEIYALVSYPDFNLQTIDQDYAAIVEQNNGAFFNNAIQGGYTPGSILKILTSAAIIESGIDQSYKDTGEEKIGGYPIKNANNKVYGDIGLEEAFAHSVNTYFANKGVLVGKDRLGTIAEKFMFNKTFDFDLVSKNLNLRKSEYNYTKWDNQAIASASIGQADIIATPLEMAMVTSTIANRGQLMKPYIVDTIKTSGGKVIEKREPEVLSTPISEQTANKIKDMMVSVINTGTGKEARLSAYQVAGKTGTAQRSSQKEINNAWFVGFAPAEDPKVCVAVVIQNVSSHGGEVAAPMARDIISYSLKELK